MQRAVLAQRLQPHIVHCIHLGPELGSPIVVVLGQTMELDTPYVLVTCMSTGATWSESAEGMSFATQALL